ncbi:MAG: hypothetical protein A07HR60_02496 [uncultured archaeon A07HR60]|nr:MAG: hypothetical protein A07HR60_02496 [uncultured archaeon A07HR60]
MSTDDGDALVRALHDHNPWWDDGANAFALPARPKSNFIFSLNRTIPVTNSRSDRSSRSSGATGSGRPRFYASL